MTELIPEAITRLLETVRADLDPESVEDVEDWLEHREWRLALDLLADSIFSARVLLSLEQGEQLKQLLSMMRIPQNEYAFLHANVKA